MNEERICPDCGSQIPENAPLGLCPTCVAGVVEEISVQVGLRPETIEPQKGPGPEESAPALEILKAVEEDSLGTVYAARHRDIDRPVQIRIFDSKLGQDPTFDSGFSSEARKLVRLEHPNIASLYEFGKENGSHFLLMERVESPTLRQLLSERRLGKEEIISLLSQICEALEYAARQGVPHMGLRPENIRIDSNGRVRLVEFGFSTFKRLAAATLPSSHSTGTGIHYVAPEQIERLGRVDERSDVYTVAMILYEMLTGELPLGRFTPPSQRADIDNRLDDVLLKALAREPERRYPGIAKFRGALESIWLVKEEALSPEVSLPVLTPGFLNLTFLTTLGASAWAVTYALVSLPQAARPMDPPIPYSDSLSFFLSGWLLLILAVLALWSFKLLRCHRLSQPLKNLGVFQWALPILGSALLLLWLASQVSEWIGPLGLFWRMEISVLSLGPLLLMGAMWTGVRRRSGLSLITQDSFMALALILMTSGFLLAAHRALPAILLQLSGGILLILAAARFPVAEAESEAPISTQRRALYTGAVVAAGVLASLQWTPDLTIDERLLLRLPLGLALLPFLAVAFHWTSALASSEPKDAKRGPFHLEWLPAWMIVLVLVTVAGGLLPAWPSPHLEATLFQRPNPGGLLAGSVRGTLWAHPTGPGMLELRNIAGIPLGSIVGATPIYALGGRVVLDRAGELEGRLRLENMVLSPDGTRLAGGRERIYLWDAETGRFLAAVYADRSAGKENVSALALSPQGRTLAIGFDSGEIQVVPIASPRPHLVIHESNEPITSLSFSTNGTLLAAGFGDGWVRVFQASSGETLAGEHLSSAALWALQFSGDGRRLAAAGSELFLWDLSERASPIKLTDGFLDAWGSSLRALLGLSTPLRPALQFDPSDSYLAVSDRNLIRIFELPNGKSVGRWVGHTGRVEFLAFSPDASRLYSAGRQDQTLRVWRTFGPRR